MRNSKIVALVATAALLVLGFAFSSFAASYNWYQQDGEWRCKNAAGDDYYAEWAKSGADWYWLNDDGFMATDALVDDDTKYVGEDGKMVKNDWKKITDEENNDHWYYFQAGGKKMVGKETVKPVTIDGKKYIFNEEGHMLTGWVGDTYDVLTEDYEWKEGIWYCGDEDDGAVTLGWKQIECFNEDEDFYDNNYWFWFGTNGQKFYSKKGEDSLAEKKINGKNYAFNEFGVMKAEWEAVRATAATATNATVSNYSWFQDAEIGAKFANGWFRVVPSENFDKTDYDDDTARWFWAKSGNLAENEIKTIGGKKYGFDEKGQMVSGLCAYEKDAQNKFAAVGIDSAEDFEKYVTNGYGRYDIYYFSDDEDNDGSMKTGLQTVKVDGDDYNFYFSTKSGSKGQGLTGKQGNKYYFNGNKVAADDAVADYLFYDFIPELEIVAPFEDLYHTFKDVEAFDYTSDGIKRIKADDYVLISKNGSVATSGTKKDGNSWKATYKKVNNVGYWYISEE